MRREVLDALASLSDHENQQRTWIQKKYPHTDFFDDLSLNIHILYDDCTVLPDPEAMIGSVLLQGEEIMRLKRLGEVLDDLLDRHEDEPDIVFLNDPDWPLVMKLAALALAAMVRSWGFPALDEG